MSDSETEKPIAVPEVKTKEKKKRPPKTEKQMEAMAKAMAALKVKREQRDKDEIEARKIKEVDVEKAKEQLRLAKQAEKEAKRVERKKTMPPALEYMTKTHFQAEMNAFKEAIIQALPKEVYRNVETIVEKPVEKITVVPKTIVREKSVPVPTPISGSALLDKIYFNR